MKIPTTFLSLFLSTALHAGPRTSANYIVATDIANAGGTRSTSTAYTNDGGVGDVTGVSTVAAPAETAKHGYIGQLTEVTALQLAATPATVNETATCQLSGVQLLDDLTTNAVPSSSITWSIGGGPLTSISSGGLATAATVYQNTGATAQGVYAGNTGTLGLTVVNTLPDNFGSYAADGIADGWQVQYFGLANPQAAPAVDADLDGLINFVEYGFGLIPTSGASLQLPPPEIIGSNLVITFLTPAGVNGIIYGAEWSTTLSTNPLDWEPISNTGSPPVNAFSVPVGSNQRMFLRLKLTTP